MEYFNDFGKLVSDLNGYGLELYEKSSNPVEISLGSIITEISSILSSIQSIIKDVNHG